MFNFCISFIEAEIIKKIYLLLWLFDRKCVFLPSGRAHAWHAPSSFIQSRLDIAISSIKLFNPRFKQIKMRILSRTTCLSLSQVSRTTLDIPGIRHRPPFIESSLSFLSTSGSETRPCRQLPIWKNIAEAGHILRQLLAFSRPVAASWVSSPALATHRHW